jgi:signal transduction histidine kinase
VELSRNLQRSREQVVATAAEERRRLSREVHDRVGPSIAALGLKLDAVRNMLVSRPEAVDAELRTMRQDAQHAAAEVRQFAHALHPPVIGLLGAIRGSCERFDGSAGGGLQVRLDAPDELPELPAATEVAALLIVKEALANVAVHAGARHCHVSLRLEDALVISVIDDGAGLKPDYRPGAGLGSMRKRAEEVGGVCRCESPPDGGTVLHVSLPLPHDTGTT